MGILVNICVVDAATHMLCFSRMDGAKTTSIEVACNKAVTNNRARHATKHTNSTCDRAILLWPEPGVLVQQANSRALHIVVHSRRPPITHPSIRRVCWCQRPCLRFAHDERWKVLDPAWWCACDESEWRNHWGHWRVRWGQENCG